MLLTRNRSDRIVGSAKQKAPREQSITAADNVDLYHPSTDDLTQGSLVENMIPKDLAQQNAMYAMIYKRDAVAGPAIDMFAELPWGEFDLNGIADASVRRIYEDSFQNIRVLELLPLWVIDYLTVGRMCCGLIFDESEGLWTDVINYDQNALKIVPRPFMNADPRIDFKPTSAMQEFFRSKDERDIDYIDSMPADLRAKIAKGDYIPLQSENTPFVHRRGSSADSVGTSILTRVLPAWAIEKHLLNGTIIGVRRRIGGLTMITAGTDSWEPTNDELSSISDLFMASEADSVGAVVAVRSGVEVNRLDSNASIWKISDEMDFLVSWKMRALGLSEGLMGGEARIETAETARSSFTERLLALRNTITERLLRNRIMLPLSKANDITVAHVMGRAEANHRQVMAATAFDFRHLSASQREEYVKIRASGEDSKYAIPTVSWRKSLEPVSDIQWLELLNTAVEKGIPIPLTMWANAIGIDLRRIEDMARSDKSLREKFKKIMEDTGAGASGEGGGDDAEASVLKTPSEVTFHAPKFEGVEDLPIWTNGACMGVSMNQTAKDLQKVMARAGNLSHIPSVFSTRAKAILGNDTRANLALYAAETLGQVQRAKLDKGFSAVLATQIESGNAPLTTKAHEGQRLLRAYDKASKVSLADKANAGIERAVAEINVGDVVQAAPNSRTLAGN